MISMKKSKKGFTLVELLAVIVVLIIILLLAINRVRKSKLETANNAVKASALSYIKAIDEQAGLDVLETGRLKKGIFDKEIIDFLGVKLSGKQPGSALFCLDNYKVINACIQYDDSQVLYENGEITKISKGNCTNMDVITCDLSSQVYSFSYDGGFQVFNVPKSGRYLIELWGAQGGDYNANNVGGKGAYTSGIINLTKNEKIYVYVGGKGVARTAGFNGGAAGGPSTDGTYTAGGGATDVRLVSGIWNNAESLKSRIMVAAGGSGTGYYGAVLHGGAGGALVGLTGNASREGCHTVATGATQTSAGLAINGGASISGFGYSSLTTNYGTGGGGGYYGGGSGNATSSCVSSGAGGSSYISGYTGCVAIDSETSLPKEGCTDGTNDNECSIHYSGKKFVNPVMKSGKDTMPSHDDSGTMTGNTGNGYARITLLG